MERWNDGKNSSLRSSSHYLVPSFHRIADRFNNFFRRAENPLQSVSPHVRQPQLRRLHDRTHFGERREEPGELFVVMDGIGFDQSQRRTESDRLADRHPRLHAGMSGERRNLPELASGVRSEQRDGVACKPFMTRLFTAEWEEGNPDTGSEDARRMSRHFRVKWDPNISRKLVMSQGDI